MTNKKRAPVCVTAYICKAVGSANEEIHHTRLQLLAKKEKKMN